MLTRQCRTGDTPMLPLAVLFPDVMLTGMSAGVSKGGVMKLTVLLPGIIVTVRVMSPNRTVASDASPLFTKVMSTRWRGPASER